MWVAVSPATPDDFTAACRALAAHEPRPERDFSAVRYRELFAAGELDISGLLVARDRAGVLRGAMLVQALPGGLGLAWAPRVEPGQHQAAVEDALAVAAGARLRASGVTVCQSFAAIADRAEMVSLLRNGFEHITTVIHLRQTCPPSSSAPFGRHSLTFERFLLETRELFAATLLATYTDSLDCPELTGDRVPDDLLDGFTGPGTPNAPGWYLVRDASRPVGVVLFDSGPEPGTIELNYLGLVPTARRQGWGDDLVRFAIETAAAAGASALTLSVDTRNTPALRLYDRHGFEEYDRRDVYLAFWPRET
jgi:ribosomal protein S18 acetylase RimI-like enzyme